MINKYKNEYINLTKDIVESDEFKKTENDAHHGSTKYGHLIRVSKCSFIMSKLFKADTETATVSGLLHDFFYGERTASKENDFLVHPFTASENAKKYFDITLEEASAIETHMYHHAVMKKMIPFIDKEEARNYNKPQSKEGWIVCISDLLVSVMEGVRFELPYLANVYAIFIISKYLNF